ncbi:hypothetical protein LX32DRAFT_336969 [Colletotrichum zoysiae]|uniref:Secreted protein n=1 Tax=Colletotrichum zoysiae TaxID=1216348 RepID=A0AAD9HJA7_9PEZI|nr:hypothetical protein LX32DRAFT_336969 [Colletotrichum zoysiae]
MSKKRGGGVLFWALLNFLSAHLLDQHPTHDYWLKPSQQNILFLLQHQTRGGNVKWTKSSALQKRWACLFSGGIFLGLGLRSLLRPPPGAGYQLLAYNLCRVTQDPLQRRHLRLEIVRVSQGGGDGSACACHHCFTGSSSTSAAGMGRLVRFGPSSVCNGDSV